MKNRFGVLSLCLLAVVVTACQITKTEPPKPTATMPSLVVEGTLVFFEPIERSEGGWGDVDKYIDKGSWIDILVQRDDIEKIKELISEQAQQSLWDIAFNDHFVVAVFQGLKPTTGYGVDILNITQSGGRILVYADFIVPDPEIGVGDTVTIPYTLVKIPKEGMDGTLIFELIVDGAVIHQTEVVINH